MSVIVKVADAIMGSGKTYAAIHHMNSHPENKFVFITPYLTEARRIKDACPELRFVEPSDKIKEYGFTKGSHLAELLRDGRNIATTHQLFKNLSPEMLGDIKRHGYSLVIDENISMLENYKVRAANINMLLETGSIGKRDGRYFVTDKGERAVDGRMWGADFIDFIRQHPTEVVSDSSERQLELFYWLFPADMITSFREVYVLTYLFEIQSLCYMLRSYGIPYMYIGVHKVGDLEYRFGPCPGTVPGYIYNIKNMIHLVDHPKLNDVGDERCALSMNWFKNAAHKEEVIRLKNNIYNYFRNLNKDVPSGERMWASYKCAHPKLTGNGYGKAFTNFNERATNAYRDRTCLAYAVNVFFNAGEKMYYNSHGIEVDEEMYALSTMVQWIWRSAIRTGKPISLYLPSKRMRGLLMNWMNELSRGNQYVG